jgi:large repetitive protein
MRVFGVLFFVFLGFCLKAQPANDNCSGAILIPVNSICTSPTSNNNNNATDSGLTDVCSTDGNDDVWFKFVVTKASQNIYAVSYTTGKNIVIAAYSGTCTSLTFLACVNNTGSFLPELLTLNGLTIGSTIYYRIYDAGSNTNGPGMVFNTCIFEPPINDECNGAKMLVPALSNICNSETEEGFIGATASGVPNACYGIAEDDVWYKFVATHTKHFVKARLFEKDVVLAAYKDDCNSLDSITCINNFGSGEEELLYLENLTIGETIYLRVFDASTSNTGTTLYICVLSPPNNDNCDKAILHQATGVQFCDYQNHIQGSTLGATDSGLADACGGDGDDDIWIKFVATDTTMFAEAFISSSISGDIVVQFYKDNCRSLDSITCNRPSISMQSTVLLTNLVIGDTIRVRIFDAGIGSTNLPIFFCAYAPAENDDCNGSLELIPVIDQEVCLYGDTYGTSDSGVPSSSTCPGITDDDIWFKFTAIQSEHNITFTTAADINPGGYVVMELRSGTCTSSSIISCAQIEYDNQSNTISYNNFTAGDTYLLRVFSSGLVALQGAICILTPVPFVPDAEDDCVTAEFIPFNNGNYSYGNGNLLGTTATTTPLSICSSGPYFDLWYKFVPSTTRHKVTAYFPESSNIVLDAYIGTNCNSLTQLSCYNNGNNGSSLDLLLENLVINDTVYLRIYDASNTATNTPIGIFITTPPVNDLCADAMLITTTSGSTCNTPTYGNTQYATGTGGCSGGSADDDVWYKFVATDDLHLISLREPTGVSGYFISSPKVEVFENTCTGASIYCHQGLSSLVPNLSSGSTYYIRVYSDGNLGGRGHFNICISTPPPNMTCSEAESLTVNSNTSCSNSYSGSTVGIGYESLWYEFTATNTSHVIDLVIDGHHFDAGINTNIYANCNIIGNFISSNIDDENKRYSYDNFIIGQTYAFQIYKGSNNEVPFTLCIKEPEANDQCAGAILVPTNTNCTCAISSTHIISSATKTPTLSYCYPQAMDVWYKFVATADQSIITITRNNSSFNNNSGSGISGYIDYTQGCNISALQCPFGINSTILNGLVAGQEYKFRITVAFIDTISICIKNLTNDYCSNAKVLTVSGNQTCSSVSGSTINASPSDNNLLDCPSMPQNDVWYEFTASCKIHKIIVTPTSNNFDASFSIYRKNSNNNAECDQDCIQNSSTIIQCVNTSSLAFASDSIVFTNFVIGTKYLIVVKSGSSSTAESGTFNICVSLPTWYIDFDGDKYGSSSLIQCNRPTKGFLISELNGKDDCNDNNPLEKPNQIWYIDNDGDRYGSTIISQCSRPPHGFVNQEISGNGTNDCDDNDALIFPGSPLVITKASGNWDNFGNWSCQAPVASTDSIIINHDILFNDYLHNQNSNFRITNGATFTIPNFSTLIIGNTMERKNIYLESGSSLNIQPGGRLFVYGKIITAPVAQIANGGRIEIKN